MKKPGEKKGYTVPKVATLTAREITEAVGPAQGLSSGAPAAVGTVKKTRGGRGRGHR